jgi:hypothetical protein
VWRVGLPEHTRLAGVVLRHEGAARPSKARAHAVPSSSKAPEYNEPMLLMPAASLLFPTATPKSATRECTDSARSPQSRQSW